MTTLNPPLDPYREQIEQMRRLTWQEAQRAQKCANRLTVLTSYIDLLLCEMRAATMPQTEAAHAESTATTH